MIENNILFFAGSLAILFAAMHSLWTYKNVLPLTEKVDVWDWLFISLNQTTIAQAFSGVAMIAASTYAETASANLLIFLVAATNAGYLLLFLTTTFLRHKEWPKEFVPQVIGALFFITVILAGLK